MLAGISGVERVEVVRGPSSVLYGTDAIGGVVNVIRPQFVVQEKAGGMKPPAFFFAGDGGKVLAV